MPEPKTPPKGGHRPFPDAIDDLKQALMDAEDALNDMLDKVPVEIVLAEGSDYQPGVPDGELRWSDMLTFHKVGKSWRLNHYRWWSHMDPEDEPGETPLIDAPLRVRVLAAKKLPDLLEAVRQRRSEEIAEIEEAAEAARVFAIRVHEEEVTRD
ncbi:MAG: hypothetical protein SangKO_097460 [Sandaracinaceae bacterium]